MRTTKTWKDLEAMELFREMQALGIEPNPVTIPCILPAFANVAALMHCGKVRDARMVFDAMQSRIVVSWNAMIRVYAMHGEAANVMQLFQSMLICKQKLDIVTFTCVLAACSQAGLTEDGCRYFSEMQ
ncbi:hypothetical protein PR202_ga04449 [Eleusine coracana subsp. coracana]|uniref:Pentatricopeptide repeat-containing protein n=1 Tax=Eleusine coracana subsp. coracana TaxID=191504 RepID=A0AAV5BQZ7_ELECO|nr:hypothetical protein PR202_ga04449 [Eleusine coracana subsp. coracana]